jgi:hypothetical protein
MFKLRRFEIQEEKLVDISRSVDALITIPGCPSVAVEVDGAHHFIAHLAPHGPFNFNSGNSWPDGGTQLRDWMLQKLGYRVASVKFYEVSPKALRNSAEQRQQPHSSIVHVVARIVRSAMQNGPEQQGVGAQGISVMRGMATKSRARSRRKPHDASELIHTRRSSRGGGDTIENESLKAPSQV